MNKIEFKVLLKGLFLNQEHARILGGYKDQRQIRRFIAGNTKPHHDLIQKLQALDRSIDAQVINLKTYIESLDMSTVSIVAYNNQAEYEKWSDGSLPFYELHLCLLFRLRKALKVEIRLVQFDEKAYLSFLNSHNFEHNQAAMAAFAGQQDK